jgi:hypothetical protein
MNKNVKIILGIGIGVGLIYLGYTYFFKQEKGATDSSKEPIVYDKKSREVVLVETN